MAKNDGWGRRLRSAKTQWEDANDRPLSYREVGELVARELGLPKAISGSTAHGWFKGQEPENWDIAFALERVLGKPPGSLVVPADASTKGRPAVQEGPDEPSEKDRAEWLNAEMEAARVEREQADAASTAAGSKSGRTRRR